MKNEFDTMTPVEREAAGNAMHNRVEMAMHEEPFRYLPADAVAGEVARAARYAPHNKGLRSDPWVGKALATLTHGVDAEQITDLGNAVIVLVSQFASRDGENSGRDSYEHPLLVGGGPVRVEPEGICDRCGTEDFINHLMAQPLERKAVTTFHIAHLRYVVEFRICDECYSHFLAGGHVIVQAVRRAAM